MEERIHSQLAYLYDLQKDCVQSLQHAKAALALEEKSNRGMSAGMSAISAECTPVFGDMTEAINYYNQALEISADPKSPDSSNLVSLLTNIAEANLSNYAEALPLLERALVVSQSITNRTMEMRVRLALGALYQQNGASVKAP
jgi:tetratricopeptide (TPR) repeat protein